MKLPIVGITMGDPAGVGPEVVMKALARAETYALCRPLVIGDARQLARAKGILKLTMDIHSIEKPEQANFKPGIVDCIDLAPVPADLPYGKVSAAAGEAAYRYIERAVTLALEHSIDAICTAPINKEAMNAAGHRFPGHTELLAKLTGTKEVSLTLLAPKLRVIHVTAHIGLLDAIEKIDAALVERTIARGRELLVRAGIRDPRIGVCGINPHAGEGGLFGRGEEETKIVPAVTAARARGWKVDGPLPADSLFYLAARGDYDLVVAMYHDQGHGPVKAMGLEQGVNVTAGLPIVRTSVDHGTAFDIAGTGKADERSMIEALRQAAALAPHIYTLAPHPHAPAPR
jgi:4-hydroxythreonine-4-phosphate dehydrogenase